MATAIQVTMLYLITSPRVMRKLLAEIDAAVADGRVFDPITNDKARKLPYLQACVKEGL
jgi:cytochrome P450